MNRQTIKREIEEVANGKEKELLLKFLSACKTEEQWLAFTICKHEKTGKFSYQTKRIWILRQNMYDLLDS